MSLFDLSGVVAALSSHTVTVKRFAIDTYNVNGRANARTIQTTFTTRASVQPPPTGKALERLGLAAESVERLSVWSVATLQLRDRVTIPGRGDFEVEHVAPWDPSGNYCKTIVKGLHATEPRS